ncbi:NAD(P)H-dependent flavin oxidoreductase [Insolitispirillum peregrinum]|uniref:NAD(P)H-dependent flavin oxidoreductase YrpB, nitropropane dioxygenase family n=1 Tax=Insolitispirillum peregrinum TaxID=80876 RepID=A0A1N7JML9_9PROT|nr:nitronate monooxygenase [Insolitispirillum peregrinum]SIS50494.1 NAD(P)H-dependent flavin oxidoreductase YrpB, nitropropane dioxygenase family [Insolitispirillum peregrinum]
MKAIKPVIISGKEVLPIVEGGKGVAVSNGRTCGAFAAAGAVGTFSGVNADDYDENGHPKPVIYEGRTRQERHRELIEMGIRGAIRQARIAHDLSNGEGRIHMNVLWEMGGAEEIMEGALEGARGLIHGVTCGAGMPYKVAEIAARHNVYYYPIISSARAFRALWKRSFHKIPHLLGGVVYEDPWLAGGHNGLTNVEDPRQPQDPLPRVIELRKTMREMGVAEVPVFMAGGVWFLREWAEWLDNAEVGPIAFQYGSRPLLTQESPIPDGWKQRLLTLKAGDVLLHRFSPTGFYSSAVRNDFLRTLEARSERQVSYSREPSDVLSEAIAIGARGREIFVTPADAIRVRSWLESGYTQGIRTPDGTMVFTTPDESTEILKDQRDCMGCLSSCAFSNWSQNEAGTTGRLADPRSFCIQKTLQSIAHGGNVENELMFAGHNAYRFGEDPFYANGFIPTVGQLVERIMQGD